MVRKLRETSESNNKCFQLSRLGIARGLFIGPVRELVYNVQTAPNCPTNYVEYKITRSL
jgi:hypothetical protein